MTTKELKKRIQFLQQFEMNNDIKNSMCNLYQQCIDQIELIKNIAEYKYADLPDASLYCKEYLNKIGEIDGQETEIQRSEESNT